MEGDDEGYVSIEVMKGNIRSALYFIDNGSTDFGFLCAAKDSEVVGSDYFIFIVV